MVDIDLSALGDKVINYITTSTNAGFISGSLIVASLYGNWYLYKKLEDYKITQVEYERIFIVLEPILTKVINKQEVTPAEIEDVKHIVSQIKFKIKKP
jgi:hypothetical protein